MNECIWNLEKLYCCIVSIHFINDATPKTPKLQRHLFARVPTKVIMYPQTKLELKQSIKVRISIYDIR